MKFQGFLLSLVALLCLGPPILHASEVTLSAEATRTDTEFLRNLAHSGKIEAQLLLGEYYYERQEFSMALPWLQMAAKQGEVEAQRRLAQMYEAGQGVPPDEEKARFWLRCATAQGDPLAVYKEGFSYATGAGIP